MEKYIILLLVVIIIGLIIYFIKNKSNKNDKNTIVNERSIAIKNNNNLPNIQIIEKNDELTLLEKNKITDTKIKNAIAILDNSASKSAMIGKNLNNANTALKNNRSFFSAAKNGTENMMKVKGTNEVYGTQAINGKFTRNTKFLNEDKMIANMGKDALVNAGFNAASMVVGQYYMNEINDKLETIQHDINNISNYLDNQYKGKLMYIISKIEEILENRDSILDNDFSIDKRYNELSRAEEKNIELLTQANSSIVELLKDNLDYKNYEKNITDIQKWSIRQQILTRLLAEIGDLRYVLANGKETSKATHYLYNKYSKLTNIVNEQLDDWHNNYCEKFGINKAEHRRNANLFKLRKNTIGKINENWNYNKLNENIEYMIDNQMNINKLMPYDTDKLDENIKIVKYKGEYYNLLESNK